MNAPDDPPGRGGYSHYIGDDDPVELDPDFDQDSGYEAGFDEEDEFEPDLDEEDEFEPDFDEESDPDPHHGAGHGPDHRPGPKLAPGPKHGPGHHHPAPPHEHGPGPKKHAPGKKTPGKKAPGKKAPGKKAPGPKKHGGPGHHPGPPHKHGPGPKHGPGHHPGPPHEHGPGQGPDGYGPEQDFGFGSGTGFGPGPASEFGPGFGFGQAGRGRQRGPGRSRRGRPGDVRAAILSLLAERPMHGYEMIKEITERSHDVWRPSPGSVYPTLQMLDDEGLICGSESGGKKRLFELTPEGRDAGAKITAPPWEQIAQGADRSQINLREALGQVVAAVTQSAYAATVEQQQRIIALLKKVRREIYAMLAESD